jgi:hypothetical protein
MEIEILLDRVEPLSGRSMRLLPSQQLNSTKSPRFDKAMTFENSDPSGFSKFVMLVTLPPGRDRLLGKARQALEFKACQD